MMREEVLASVARIGGRLGELRLDTDLDISHGVVRYLELLKLAALVQRPAGQGVEESLADINARLLAATTPLQREIFQTSTLDQALLDGDGDERARAHALGPREEHSLEPFLPRKGAGLALSASDVAIYRSCPLRYKFARVLRIPTEQTLHQRFGIVVHQVLERYHAAGGETLAQLLELLEVGWRSAGFGESESDLELLPQGRAALARYHARLHGQDSEPVWFERSFDFRLGPHHLRGRVDRVDRLAGGAAGAAGEEEYELIDYKTSRPKTVEQLKDDIQLSLYALAAREDWGLESSRQAYYYVLDDLKVPVPRSQRDAEAVKDIVLEVGEGILAQAFEPTPSHEACSICDYRIVCPAAAERRSGAPPSGRSARLRPRAGAGSAGIRARGCRRRERSRVRSLPLRSPRPARGARRRLGCRGRWRRRCRPGVRSRRRRPRARRRPRRRPRALRRGARARARPSGWRRRRRSGGCWPTGSRS